MGSKLTADRRKCSLDWTPPALRFEANNGRPNMLSLGKGDIIRNSNSPLLIRNDLKIFVPEEVNMRQRRTNLVLEVPAKPSVSAYSIVIKPRYYGVRQWVANT